MKPTIATPTNGKPRAGTVRGVLYVCMMVSLILGIALQSRGATKAPGEREESSDTSNELTVSLITCWPGEEIYELCGHEAIRIQGEGIDSVWNFGLFDFSEPNFVYRFVKGETDYRVGGYEFSRFLPEYIARGSQVAEQELNLTQAEAREVRKLLQHKSLPPNDRYRYNYIRNNCSTQIADLLDEATANGIVYGDSTRFGSFREAMASYHKNYPWYQFGINVALGSELDRPLTQREEFFIPTELYRHAGKATRADGSPLVKTTRILNPGREDAVLPPTPFWLGPLFWSIIVAAISAAVCYAGWRRQRIYKLWYAVYYGMAGLAGCLVFFLVFISEHAATSPNMLIFWLNPLQLIIPIFLWTKKMRGAVTAMMWLNICASIFLLIFWPLYSSGQSHEASFLLLIGTDLLLAAAYAAIEGKKENLQHNKKRKRRKK